LQTAVITNIIIHPRYYISKSTEYLIWWRRWRDNGKWTQFSRVHMCVCGNAYASRLRASRKMLVEP